MPSDSWNDITSDACLFPDVDLFRCLDIAVDGAKDSNLENHQKPKAVHTGEAKTRGQRTDGKLRLQVNFELVEPFTEREERDWTSLGRLRLERSFKIRTMC